ncbi:conserved hypothetical protein [Actinosynnema mirum DSM 43827]|uniref:Tryptophan-associated transmembrane protein n=1 Tax=Actinosynnema mirum (strain ATCC 29888 / DSM 43827 / JCM 3225 / NBRC 14064 / NCIMB 13271 / NRRL B-12336 / IMRU 3971 / 101) TaxID=446462 RepID=C6WCD0_ACTMD|nr:conserved hypothetical protein [Actinosynnema mirum DSM 43827]
MVSGNAAGERVAPAGVPTVCPSPDPVTAPAAAQAGPSAAGTAEPAAAGATATAADATDVPRPPRPGRREQRLVLGLLLLAALVLWGSSALDWGAAEPQWPVPLALLAGAGVAAVPALGGVVRRALGAVLAVVGLLAVAVGVGDLPASGPVVGLTGALAVVAAGVLLLVKGGRMPRMGDRYETPAARRPSADPERELWNALERGDDPTERD